MYHPLITFANERLISSFSLVVSFVLRVDHFCSEHQTPHSLIYIFRDHLCSEHHTPRHLAPIIHVLSSRCYVHRAPRHLAAIIHVFSSFMLRISSAFIQTAICHLLIYFRVSLSLIVNDQRWHLSGCL